MTHRQACPAALPSIVLLTLVPAAWADSLRPLAANDAPQAARPADAPVLHGARDLLKPLTTLADPGGVLADWKSKEADRAAAASLARCAAPCDGSPEESGDPACARCNCDPCRCWHGVAGAELTFLWPSSQSSVAGVALATPAVAFTRNAQEHIHLGPRVWLGIEGDCWGFRGRYWRQDDAADHADPILLVGDTSGFVTENSFEAYTVDAELTRRFWCNSLWCTRRWDLVGSFGFRFAAYKDLAYVDATATDGAAPPAVVEGSAIAMTEFEGPGITFALGADRPIRCWQRSQLKAFWNLRGSVLWGDTSFAAQTAVNVFDPILGQGNRIDIAAADATGDLWIGEIQLGLQWEGYLRNSPAVPFARIAFEYQHWGSGALGLATTTSAAAVNANTGTAFALATPNLDLDLIGFTVGAGIEW